jgi:CRISPR-associated protein Csx3
MLLETRAVRAKNNVPQTSASGASSKSELPYEVYQVLDVVVDGVIEPSTLQTIKLPLDLTPREGVIISGRAPFWVYAALTNKLNPYLWIATYDPRIGAVVVASHSKDIKVGQVIDIVL